MRTLLPLLLLAACGKDPTDGSDGTGADDTDTVDDTDAPPADDTDSTADDTDPTDDTDTAPPGDPCYAQPTTIQLGGVDEGVFSPFTPGGTVRLGKGEQGGGAWHVEWAANVTYAPQLIRVSASLNDVETGLQLAVGREPDNRNITATPPVLGQPWACVGQVPESNLQLDPRGLDEDESVDEWIEVCGRTVRLEVTLRDAASADLGFASVEFVLAPFPGDAESCPGSG